MAATGRGRAPRLVLAMLLVRPGRLAMWLGIGVALCGLPVAAIGAMPQEAAAIALHAVVRIGNALVDVGAFTLPARLADETVLARLFAGFEGILTLGVAAGAALAPVVVELLGIVNEAPAHATQHKLGTSSSGVSAGGRRMLRSDPFVEREQESQPRSDQELTAPEEAEMARITRLELDPITIDTANATVDVHLDVSFSRSDKDANTPYKVECTLLGDDPGGEFGEDNTDDVIPNGTLTVAGQTIRADGLDVQTLDFSKTLAKEKLNEDLIGGANPDEIKAHVVLTPVIAHPTEADSNIRRLSIA